MTGAQELILSELRLIRAELSELRAMIATGKYTIRTQACHEPTGSAAPEAATASVAVRDDIVRPFQQDRD